MSNIKNTEHLNVTPLGGMHGAGRAARDARRGNFYC